MGIVAEPVVALMSPCTCYKYEKDGRVEDICWSPGIVGVLTQEQEELYCPEKIYKGNVPKKLKRRWEKFSDLVEYCKDYRKHGYESYWECMDKESEKREEMKLT